MPTNVLRLCAVRRGLRRPLKSNAARQTAAVLHQYPSRHVRKQTAGQANSELHKCNAHKSAARTLYQIQNTTSPRLTQVQRGQCSAPQDSRQAWTLAVLSCLTECIEQ